MQRAASARELDDPVQYDLAAADPARLLDGPPPILIDEWQYLPETWDVVRRAVDRGAAPGSYLLTGSSRPTELGSHSGAARIVSVRMRPLALAERGLPAPTFSTSGLLSGARPPTARRLPAADRRPRLRGARPHAARSGGTAALDGGVRRRFLDDSLLRDDPRRRHQRPR